MKTPWLSFPRSPKLICIHCRPDDNGGYVHNVYEGRKMLGTLKLNGILTNETHLQALRDDWFNFQHWVLSGAL